MHDPKTILKNLEEKIAELETRSGRFKWLYIEDVYKDLGIFDWWLDKISITQLRSMRSFLKTAIELGYTGYACFKVGAAGCAHGMWANKKESTNGYSPDGACLFHSFRKGDNYWCYCRDNNTWNNTEMSTAELKAALAKEAEGGN